MPLDWGERWGLLVRALLWGRVLETAPNPREVSKRFVKQVEPRDSDFSLNQPEPTVLWAGIFLKLPRTDGSLVPDFVVKAKKFSLRWSFPLFVSLSPRFVFLSASGTGVFACSSSSSCSSLLLRSSSCRCCCCCLSSPPSLPRFWRLKLVYKF